MKNMSTPITQEQLKAILDYCPETGVFRWRNNVGWNGRIKAGSVAGGLDQSTGYMQIKLFGRRYLQHRLAFLYMTGAWPSKDIDHINGNRNENAWANLRDVSRSINLQNMRRPHRDNKAGKQGVCKTPSGRFRAEIYAENVKKHIGTFDTAEQAHAAYCARKLEFHTGVVL